MYKEAEEITKYGYQTLLNCKWLSSQIEFSRRRENLSWGHHLEVASLPPDQQDYRLDRAEREENKKDELKNVPTLGTFKGSR